MTTIISASDAGFITASDAAFISFSILVESKSMKAFLARLDAHIRENAMQCKSFFVLGEAVVCFAAEGTIEWDEVVLGTIKLPPASVKYVTDVLTAHGYAITAVNGPSGNTVHVSW